MTIFEAPERGDGECPHLLLFIRTHLKKSDHYGSCDVLIMAAKSNFWNKRFAGGLVVFSIRGLAVGTVPIKCFDEEFSSIAALAARYGIDRIKVNRRLNQGWSPEQAVDQAPRKKIGSRQKPVTVNGHTYDSLSAAANANNLSPGALFARIKSGYSLENALQGTLKKRKGPSAKKIEFQGKIYESHEELCRSFDQRWSNVQRRINRGWTLEQALGIVAPPPRFRDHEGHARQNRWKQPILNLGSVEPSHDGSGYKLYVVRHLKSGKEYVGLTITSLEQRFRQHLAAAKSGRKSAFYNALRKYGAGEFVIELIRSDATSYRELQEQEIREIALRDSVKKGYNTASGGANGTTKKISIAGKIFSSYGEAAATYGIDPTVFSLRLTRLKWTPEEAAGLVRRPNTVAPESITVDGVTYPSLKAVCEAHGVPYKRFYARYKSQAWTLRQALGLDAPPGPEIG